jgi:hypothetical protein
MFDCYFVGHHSLQPRKKSDSGCVCLAPRADYEYAINELKWQHFPNQHSSKVQQKGQHGQGHLLKKMFLGVGPRRSLSALPVMPGLPSSGFLASAMPASVATRCCGYW